MVKRYLLPVIALVVLWVASVWLIGWRTQHAIEDGLVHFNERISTIISSDLSQADAQVSIEQYSRGWSTAHVRYRVTLTDRHGENTHYFLDDVLEHGPFPWSMLRQGQFRPVLAYSEATLEATPDMHAWLAPDSGMETPLHITTEVGFRGKAQSRLQLSALASPPDESTHIAFSGGELFLEVSDQFRTSQLRGHFDRYRQRDDHSEEVITLTGIDVDAQTSQLAESDGLDHHSQMRVESLAISQGEGIPPMMLQGIETSLATSQRH